AVVSTEVISRAVWEIRPEMRLKFFLCGDIGSLPVGSASEVKVDRTLRLEWKFVALKALETGVGK
ncbi:MAG: hypothetical protein DMG78_26610, partial [Acidobacteria bacterium]